MLDRVSIAAPCPVDWESMPGTDRVRHCSQCNKNVYNLSAMTRRQAEALLRETEGNLCARLYRRADGTILTENCPAGLRTIGRRISRVAGAAMSAMMAFTSTAAAQIPLVQISPHEREATFAISGVVADMTGAVIPGAQIEVDQEGSDKTFTTQSNNTGAFRLDSLARGSYRIKVSRQGFNTFERQVLLLVAREYRLQATLQVGSSGGVIVIVDPVAND